MDNSKVKVLHVTFNMGIGGTEQVIRQIVENSSTERFQHEILCIDGEIGALGVELQAKGFYIESTQRQAGTDFKLLKFMRQYAKRRNIDVLHCHQYTPYFYGVLSALFTGVKVIFTEHGRFYPDRHNSKRKFVNPLLVMATNYITTISKSTANALAEYEYMPLGKIQVIYNGINEIDKDDLNRENLLHDLDLSEDYKYIGTVSRLEPIKNQTMMIKAFSEVKKVIPAARLVLIGDGAKMQELKSLVNSLGMNEEVIFTGFINNPQKYISLFEVFLLSSFSEGTSMTLLEAMSLVRPCVVTNVGGNPEIVINGQTGMVVPSDDAEQFSIKIIELLSDGKLSEQLGRAGREEYLEKYSVSRMLDCYQELYTE